MGCTVTVQEMAPRLVAASRGPKMMPLLDAAWAFIKQSGTKSDGHNIAIYRRDFIEAGAGVFAKFEPQGPISCIATPSGNAAWTVHIGPYDQLGKPHAAIREWCNTNGHQLEGTKWEIYGHWEEDPAKLRTDLYYLLAH